MCLLYKAIQVQTRITIKIAFCIWLKIQTRVNVLNVWFSVFFRCVRIVFEEFKLLVSWGFVWRVKRIMEYICVKGLWKIPMVEEGFGLPDEFSRTDIQASCPLCSPLLRMFKATISSIWHQPDQENTVILAWLFVWNPCHRIAWV